MIGEKRCSKCGEIKPIDDFYKRDGAKDGHRNDCINCNSLMKSVYYSNNKQKISLCQKEWRKNNPDKSKAIYAKYRATEKRRKVAREWAKRNRKSGLVKFVERYNSDIQFNIAIKFRRRIYMAIRNQYTTKAHKTIDLLGTTYDSLRKYIEGRFTDGMSWEGFMAGEIHLDHIVPCSSFDLSDIKQQKVCFHYTNLQPLWAKDNLHKSNKLTKHFQPMLAL